MSSGLQSAGKRAVSIVIPFYNPGSFFLPALQSVFAQTFTDWELLLIDDGSKDGSLEIASRLEDERVKVFADGANRGLSYRLNQGAQLACGEYLFRMDADDIMHPERLGLQLAVLQASSRETVVGTACYSIDMNSKVVGWRPVNSSQNTGFAARHSFIHPTVAATTSWFRKNPYSEEYIYRRAEDSELWCRTATSAEFKWIERPLFFYREIGVFSLGNYLAGEEALLELIRRLEHGLPRRWILGAKELVKIGLFRGLAALHCNDLIVRHRYRKLLPNGLEEAERAISLVMQTALPTGYGE
jgi:glycosyltransferase involved in cell wall biosynthesis